MNTHYGATPEAWLHWRALGIGSDLLPVVCEPGLTLSPSSTLTSYGKVPSRFDRSGHVVGFPKWTQYRSSLHNLSLWSGDPRLGICLQTRQIRALDLDIDEPGLAQRVRATITTLHGDLPLRTRPNSSKCLFLFELPGEFSKQVLRTDHGMIEFLANGQQCVVEGTHPSGSRYEWLDGLPDYIPDLTHRQWEELKALLYQLYGTTEWTNNRQGNTRVAGASTGEIDPVVAFIAEKGLLVHGQPDRVDVVCPWVDDHSTDTDASSTSYFPAGTGGFETGNFRCLHAHCLDKGLPEFLRVIGWDSDGFEDISTPFGEVSQSSVLDALTGDVVIADVEHPLALPHFDRQPKTGKIKPILNNLLLFLSWLCDQGEGIRFDVFRDEILITPPPRPGEVACERSFTDADYTRLQSLAERGAQGFAPLSHELMRRAVHTIAQDRCFDSAQAWINGLPPWDGTDRITQFCHQYLGAEDSVYATAVSRYLWSAMAGRILHPGVQADMSVILVSDQGTGKSTSIRSMAPMRDCYIDLSLSDRDADLARLTRGKTLVELSELRGLHTKEMDAIKAFVTRLESEWVPKYFEMRTVYLRRFIMIGTTNNDEFLGDATGERRWLPLRVGTQAIDQIRRDHTQLWSQARELFRTEGILWEAAQRLGVHEHEAFSTFDVITTKVDQWLSSDQFGEKPCDREFLHLYEVMRDGLGYDQKDLTRPNQMRVGDVLRRLGYTSLIKWLEGKNQRVWVKKTNNLDEVVREVVSEFF